MTDQKLLTTKEAAERLGMSPVTLSFWRSTGTGPGLPYVKIGCRNVRYRPDDIKVFIERHVVES